MRKDGVYVVNGAKAWITNGGAADAAIVYVNTHPEKGEKGITALVIEKGTPGFSVGKEEKKLGIHAKRLARRFPSADCEVPAENRDWKRRRGLQNRACHASMAAASGIASKAGRLGIAQVELSEAALSYAQQRQAFGRPIAEFQAIQFILADMATEIDAALLSSPAAPLGNRIRSARFTMEASVAKLFASEMATRKSRTKRSRFTAVTDTAANTRSSAPIATHGSPKFTKGPVKFSVW